MYRNWIAYLCVLCFFLQGTIFKWIIPASWQSDLVVAPQLILIIVLMIGLYGNRYWALIAGLSLGLLQDIVFYGPMIGTYTFTLGLMGYLAGLAGLRRGSGVVKGMAFVAAGDLLFHFILFSIYRLFQLTHMPLSFLFLRQMIPTLLFDLLFALAIFIPVRNRLELAMEQMQSDESADI